MLVELNTSNPQPRQINRIVQTLERGGIIVYPTDTTYALGCDIENRKAAQQIKAIKQMPKGKLLSLVCPDLKAVSQYGYVGNQAYKLLKHCLPGPYTFILKATKLVPKVMMTKRKTIGVRITSNIIAQTIVENLGRPMVTASVRISGEEIMSDPELIYDRLGHQLDFVIDAGMLFPEPSSVIDLSEEPPIIVRKGKGDISFIAEV